MMNCTGVVGAGQRGFTLIELMVALVLGVLVVGAASAIFLSNSRVYGNTETLNRLQESGRVSFELLARDVRAAGMMPCGTPMADMDSVLNPSAGSSWIADFSNGLVGGTNAHGDVLRLFSGSSFDHGDIFVTKHDNPSAVLDVTLIPAGAINVSDILIVCNAARGFIFQTTQLTGNNLKIGHNTGSGVEPGNCGQNFDPNCTNGANEPGAYCFSFGRTCMRGMPAEPPPPAQILKLSGVEWYVAGNGRVDSSGVQGTSLYRAPLNVATATREAGQEIVEGVTGMQLTYQQGTGGFVAASNVTNWPQVRAVRVRLTFAGVEGSQAGAALRGTDGEVFERTLDTIITVRNRPGVL